MRIMILVIAILAAVGCRQPNNQLDELTSDDRQELALLINNLE